MFGLWAPLSPVLNAQVQSETVLLGSSDADDTLPDLLSKFALILSWLESSLREEPGILCSQDLREPRTSLIRGKSNIQGALRVSEVVRTYTSPILFSTRHMSKVPAGVWESSRGLESTSPTEEPARS